MTVTNEETHHSILQGRRPSVPKFDPKAKLPSSNQPASADGQPSPPRKESRTKREERNLSERMLTLRSGSRCEPYPRTDGVETARFNFTATAAFVQKEREFSAKLRAPWTRTTFLEHAITKAMAEFEEKSST